MKIVLLLFLLTFILPQTSAVNIRRLGSVNGLSNNNIVSITQDREGFIWISTKDGLNRFDGKSFKIFRHDEANANSISSNVLNCVYADPHDDVVWIGTEKNGLNAYNYKSHQFTRYLASSADSLRLSGNGVTHISGDSEGNLWLATYNEGINFFDKQSGTFKRFNTSNIRGLVSNFNWYVLPDGDKVYVGHVVEGFSIIDLTTRSAINFKNISGNPESLTDNSVTCIFKDSEGEVWIGTRNGLVRFNPISHRMIPFVPDQSIPFSLTTGFIKSIVETPNRKLWIGTEGGGINILDMNDLKPGFNPKSIHFEHIVASNIPTGLSTSSVQSLILDSFGNFWAGGFVGGLNFIQEKDNFFRKISYLPFIGNDNSLASGHVVGLSPDNQDQLWVANGIGGMSMYRDGVKVIQHTSIPGHANPLNVMAITAGRRGNIWLGNSDGSVFEYLPASKRFVRLHQYPLINVPVYCILEDSQGALWVSSDHGLYVFNPATGTGATYDSSNSPLPDGNIRPVAEDHNGNFWVGTLGGGLQVYDQSFRLLHDYGQHFDFYSINHIYRDSRNRMWVASLNDLFLFPDYQPENVTRIGKRNGLRENNVVAIIEGATADDLWLSTTNGISYMNLTKDIIRNFDVSDDIAMGDYSKMAVGKTSDGMLHFASQHGITVFHQQPMERIISEVLPVVSSFLVAERTRTYTADFSEFAFGEKVVLNYNQNTFQLNFNVPDYSLNNKVEFAYQLSGLDESWYFINKEKQVTFRTLRPGKYTFRIKARQQNAEWPESYTAMRIVIHPPYWLSWWAKALYVAFALLIAFLILHFFKKKLELENSLILETGRHQQEQLLNEERLKFYTNLTHELRTPMTLILGPLEDMVADKSLSPPVTRKLNAIQRVANNLLNLINQILEFRKSETKNRDLNVKRADIIPLVQEIGFRFSELHRKSELELRLLMPKTPIEIYYDVEVVSIILDNLISNAYKFTSAGNITIEVKAHRESNLNYVDLIVADTGTGIPKEEQTLIFNRYYQAKNRMQTTGTGIGLALVRNMVELHEAEIFVDSVVGHGTTFTVRLLADNSYPDAIHPDVAGHDDPISIEESARSLVLVLDDNADILDYIHESLSDSYEIITAPNGIIGYQMACQQIPDVIISDVMMPGMDGIELCKALKSNMLTSHVPVVLLTARTTLQEKTEGYDAGADSYITKPFSGSLLKSRIKNLLHNRTKLNHAYNSFVNKKTILNESASDIDKAFVEQLTTLIEQQIEDESLNIGQLAMQLHMSHSSLYRKIKALTDLTANEFIKKVRMQVAEQLLITNKFTINEVMYKVGMNSANYFRTCFREEFGLTPRDYLQKLKQL